MSNFEVELKALVSEWLKRGDDPQSMKDALDAEASELWAKISPRREKD